MILATHGIIASQIASFDADAAAFFNRVTAAGGTLSATEKIATNQLVLDLKANSLWTPMKAIYPMVGASAAACSRNLKADEFNGTFTSTGWTFASTGATPNGTSAYFDTTLNLSTHLSGSLHYGYYCRTTNTTGRDIGVEQGSFPYDLILSLGGTLYNRFSTGSSITGSNSDSKGFYVATQDSTNLHRLFRNNSQFGTTQAYQTGQPSLNVFIGAINNNGSADYFTNRQCAFASIGEGLTNTQASNFYTAVNSFQVSLSRNV
jgi:hypothetical protein